ncbi:DsrE family protein [Pelobium sp.]|nr:DsrE family protein [Pelobium sp.]MDA9554786.1 DsrE family protein [Pelobium sp.]
MKKLYLIALAFLILGLFSLAIAKQNQLNYNGAKPSLTHYKALYILGSDDPHKMIAVLGNIKNAINDPRLKNKLSIELVVFGAGVKLYDKNGLFEKPLKRLKDRGVILAQCENTLKKRHVAKSSLYTFVSFVPSATGEMIIRGSEGWAILP